MKEQARIQAAIDLLDAIVAAARDGGPAADTLIARYFRERRYAGSKDRRVVRDFVYDAVRRTAERPEDGRAAMVGLAQDRPELAALFDGSPHGPAPIEPGETAAEAAAVPRWIKPLLAELVNEAEQAALLERAPIDLRVNRLKGTRDEAIIGLPDAEHLTAQADGWNHAIRLPEGYPVEQSDVWKQGLVEVQDAGSQIIVAACEARPGQIVIDLCAGAGGKTLALAADMGGTGRLIASDTNRARLSRLGPRAERAGAAFIETLLLDPGKEAAMLAPFAGQADIILIDAPCSGTGTWRRNPEARWRLTPDRLARLEREQARILDIAMRLLAPAGCLVYAVCSLLDREGKDQIDAFLSRHSGWTAAEMAGLPGRTWGGGRLLTPLSNGTDGFFFARLTRI